MKVVSKQRNSKMCAICGMDNKYGVHAQFYNMEDGSVMSKFRYREEHQSYPGRVHGGLITAMLDEMGLRALWAKEGNVLANGTIKYIKLDNNKITGDIVMHEEMCYLLEDDVKEI